MTGDVSNAALLRQQNPVVEMRASVDGKPEQKFVGRFAATLDALILANEGGLSPLDWPMPRWAHYVYRLRRDGVVIETVTEAHAGPFSGTHARYVLRSEVKVIERINAEEGRSDAAA
jgi:hypothetical protein